MVGILGDGCVQFAAARRAH